MILNKHQIKQLKSLANTCDIRYKVGKKEISDNLIEVLDKGITKHELIKVDLMHNIMSEKEKIAEELAQALHAELITIIGGVIVLYRKNLKSPKIKLVD